MKPPELRSATPWRRAPPSSRAARACRSASRPATWAGSASTRPHGGSRRRAGRLESRRAGERRARLAGDRPPADRVRETRGTEPAPCIPAEAPRGARRRVRRAGWEPSGPSRLPRARAAATSPPRSATGRHTRVPRRLPGRTTAPRWGRPGACDRGPVRRRTRADYAWVPRRAVAASRMSSTRSQRPPPAPPPPTPRVCPRRPAAAPRTAARCPPR